MERLTEPQSRADREQYEADQAQIAAALASAQAKRNLKAPAPAAPFQNEVIMVNGVPHLPAPAPREFLRLAFADRIAAWTPRDSTDKGGHARAVEALECLNTALSLLEARKGDRAQETREWLAARRDRIVAALAAYASACGGPLELELIDRIEKGREAVAAAQRALHFARPAEVRDCRLKIDEAEAAGRELDRDIRRAADAMQFPSGWPSLQEFHEAQCATIDLERKPGKRPRVRDIMAAIEEGMRANETRARLWVIYESKSEAEHELLNWRWRGYTERNK